MNPLVKKEIRLLLPGVAVCGVLGLTNFFFRFDPDGSLVNAWVFVLAFVLCGAMTVMLAISSFGSEISSGTFSNLLAQPISRQKLWDTKILVLAVSLLAVGIFWSACGAVRLAMLGRNLGLLDLVTTVGTFGLVVFSGGLWTVLLVRQVAAAFWFTVLVPGVMLVGLVGLLAGNSDEFNEGVIASVLGAYSLAGFFFARWLFFRAQDVQWSGGAIVLPEMRGLARLKLGAGAHRARSPRAALWRKEFQLYQSQFIMALALAVFHLGVIATRKWGHFPRNSSTEFILEIFWGLWLVMPFLVGCAAVAEERKLGTHEAQLCLPVTRRAQFTVKLCVVLLLSILFGVAMPLLFEGTRVLPDVQIGLLAFGSVFGRQIPTALSQTIFGHCIVEIGRFLPLLTFAGLATAIGTVSFYISTLTRNTLQALAPAVLAIMLGWSLMIAARAEEFVTHPLWHGWLIYFIGVPVMLLALLGLAFRNFRHFAPGWKLWLRNLLVLAASLSFAIAATVAIYHRAWDKLTPYEPPHGVARLTLADPASLSERGNEIFVRLSDGRIWTTHFVPGSTSSNLYNFVLGDFKVAVATGSFLDGPKWTTVKRSLWEWVGIKTDGTLWVSEKSLPAGPVKTGEGKMSEEEMRHLVQFGNETNWSSLQPLSLSVLLVKNDGTLWRWGPHSFDLKHKPWPGLRTFTPYRLGTESDWAEVSQHGYDLYFRKTDGSIWTRIYNPSDTNKTTLQIDQELTLQSMAGPGHSKFRSMAVVRRGMDYRVGIRDDGTFRIWADQRSLRVSHSGDYDWSPVDLPIGSGTNWLAVADSKQKLVTLKDDGSLWLWDFSWNRWRGWNPYRDERELQNATPVRLGTHSDWIAIASGEGVGFVNEWGYILSLAADGSLWYWPLERPDYYYGFDQKFEPLLDFPRKPLFLGNIFRKTD